jgi:hypothetical protein
MSIGARCAAHPGVALLGCLVRFFKVAFVLASWRRRDVLHGIQRQSQSPPPLFFSPLRWACCSRGCAVSYRSRGRPPNPFSLSRPASPVRLATLLSVHCLCLCCNSHTCLHSVSMRRRIILPYSRIHQRPGSVHALHENIHRGFVYCCSWGIYPQTPTLPGAWPAAPAARA